MLFHVWGSSGSGKSVVLPLLRSRFPDIEMHDFDELGVPHNPTRAWRAEMTERWLERAVELQHESTTMLLAGQVPLDELVSSPAASELTEIASCLLDCDESVRLGRMRARPDFASLPVRDLLEWADVMRSAASGSSARVTVIDTTELSIEEAADSLANWMIDADALGS